VKTEGAQLMPPRRWATDWNAKPFHLSSFIGPLTKRWFQTLQPLTQHLRLTRMPYQSNSPWRWRIWA